MNSDDFSKYIGARIKTKRKILGLSISRLADMLGLSYQQVQKYEAGHSKISAEKLAVIAYALNEPVSFFYEDIDLSQLDLNYMHQKPVITGTRHQKMQVMLIEDNPKDIILFCELAKQTEYIDEVMIEHRAANVMPALTARASCEALSLPDIIFLDIRLPDGCGIELLKKIKSDKSLRHIVTVIISASVEWEDMKRCYEYGAASYILKSNRDGNFDHHLWQVFEYWGKYVVLPNM